MQPRLLRKRRNRARTVERLLRAYRDWEGDEYPRPDELPVVDHLAVQEGILRSVRHGEAVYTGLPNPPDISWLERQRAAEEGERLRRMRQELLRQAREERDRRQRLDPWTVYVPQHTCHFWRHKGICSMCGKDLSADAQ